MRRKAPRIFSTVWTGGGRPGDEGSSYPGDNFARFSPICLFDKQHGAEIKFNIPCIQQLLPILSRKHRKKGLYIAYSESLGEQQSRRRIGLVNNLL